MEHVLSRENSGGHKKEEGKKKKKKKIVLDRQETEEEEEDIFANVGEIGKGGDYEVLMKTLGEDESGSSSHHKQQQQNTRRHSFNGSSPSTPTLVRRDSGRGQTIDMYVTLSKEVDRIKWDHAAILGRICKLELDETNLQKEIHLLIQEKQKTPKKWCCCFV